MKRLLDVMARLRDPKTGCPWDREQSFRTIAPYTLEEAYEVADAIERADFDDLRDELGDLLLQVVFHARIAEEAGLFDFAAVVDGIVAKMVRRHPHVFSDEVVESAAAQQVRWDEIKAAEQAGRQQPESLLADIPVALPALTRAVKMGKRAARIGFDFPNACGPRDKVSEEVAELDEAIAYGDAAHVEAELGDVLLAVANLARHLKVDPEAALRRANERFAQRFAHVEAEAARHPGADIETLEAAWQRAKRHESSGD